MLSTTRAKTDWTGIIKDEYPAAPEQTVFYDIDENIAVVWRGGSIFNVFEHNGTEWVEVHAFTSYAGLELEGFNRELWALRKAETYVNNIQDGDEDRYWVGA